jgi:AraC-like DNA-binding protein
VTSDNLVFCCFILFNTDRSLAGSSSAIITKMTHSLSLTSFLRLSPHQYVIKARLDRAQELLAGSDLTIAQVADALGFTSQSHFTRAFRAHAGQTPSAWRATKAH